MNLIATTPTSVKPTEPRDDKTIIRRFRRDDPYTQIENTLLQDYSISPQTTGILVRLMSMDVTWNISKAWIKKHFRIGDHRIDSAFKEAREHGYMHYSIEKGRDGKFSKHVYTICDFPIFLNKNNDPDQSPEIALLDKLTTPGKTSTGKSTARKTTPLKKKQSKKETREKTPERHHAGSKTNQRWIDLAKKDVWDKKTKSLYSEFVERYGHQVVEPPPHMMT